MIEVKNWILKKHITDIEILGENYLPDYANYLTQKGVSINKVLSKSKTFINWDEYKRYEFLYDYEGSESEIRDMFLKSDLINHEYVSMDFGKGNPIILIKTKYFIDNWYEFITGAHFESTVVSENGKCILEFKRDYFLLSNFKI